MAQHSLGEGKVSYEAKRDRWNGYDPNAFRHVIDEWNELNDEEKKRRSQELQEKLRLKAEKKAAGHDSFDDDDDSSDNSDPDLEKEGEGIIPDVDESDPRKKTIVRNLRNREDTAKYLRNLDPNSAAYSGKSRTMNDNPNPDVPMSQSLFKGDNMAKFSGDFLKYLNQEAFTLESSKAGVELNHVAMPSQVEILQR